MENGNRVKLGIVCILFNRPLNELGIYQIIDTLTSNFELFLFDNSTYPNPELINRPYYYWSKENVGTAGGYTYSIEELENRGCSHIMLLDQDTIIDNTFLEEVISNLKESPQKILIPRIGTETGIISPSSYHWWFGNQNIPFVLSNKLHFKTAISTGSIHPISIIKKYMPFPKEFWLDYFDHWLFYNYSNDSISIKPLNNILNHDLSVHNINQMGYTRLKNIYRSESTFIKTFGPKSARLFLIIRILFRQLKSLASGNIKKTFNAQWPN